MLYALARPLLFALDPETAHQLTLELADAPLRFGLLRVALAVADDIARDPPPMDEAMRALRRAKDAVHLAAALGG